MTHQHGGNPPTGPAGADPVGTPPATAEEVTRAHLRPPGAGPVPASWTPDRYPPTTADPQAGFAAPAGPAPGPLAWSSTAGPATAASFLGGSSWDEPPSPYSSGAPAMFGAHGLQGDRPGAGGTPFGPAQDPAGGPAPVPVTWAYPPGDEPDGRRSDRRTTAVLGAAVAAVLVAVLVLAVVWLRGGSPTTTAATPVPGPSAAAGPTAPDPASGPVGASPTTASPTPAAPATSAPAAAVPPTVTVLTTAVVPSVPPAPAPVTVTVTAAPPAAPQPPPAPGGGRAAGDLGLRKPISTVSCNGTPIVLYVSAITPGAYAADVQAGLDAHPGSSYLRTDQACTSLTQSVDGNAIYAVFRAYPTVTAACAAEGPGTALRFLEPGSPDTSTFLC